MKLFDWERAMLALVMLSVAAPARGADDRGPVANPAGSEVATAGHGRTIVSFTAVNPSKDGNLPKDTTAGSGPLHIVYSTGAETIVQNVPGDETMPGSHQDRFDNIQLAEDKHTIGWLGGYMICSQSYDCDTELVLYREDHIPAKIYPTYGIIWDWRFVDHGKRVVTHSGFPHGDNAGAYALYDTGTGLKLDEYAISRNAPKWVRQYEDPNEYPER